MRVREIDELTLSPSNRLHSIDQSQKKTAYLCGDAQNVCLALMIVLNVTTTKVTPPVSLNSGRYAVEIRLSPIM